MNQTILTHHIKKLVLSALFLSLGLVLPFFTAIPGIALQLVFIPVMMVALGKAKMVPFHSHRHLFQGKHFHHE